MHLPQTLAINAGLAPRHRKPPRQGDISSAALAFFCALALVLHTVGNSLRHASFLSFLRKFELVLIHPGGPPSLHVLQP